MAHPKNLEAQQAAIDTNPFENMLISDTSILDRLDGRNPCPKCGKSRKFFCYTCYVPIEELSGKLPKIKLPLKIDIIKHKNEIDGKSTACHAAILAPEDVTIYTYPKIPNYDENDIVLIFPSTDARSIQQVLKKETINKPVGLEKGHHIGTLMKELNESIYNSDKCINLYKEQLPIRRAVFIDSTWNQSRGIYKDDRIKKLPCVVIHNRISQFWRHQKGSPRWYLATIEAIHQFLVEIHISAWGINSNYNGLRSCFSNNYLQQCIKLENKEAYNGQYDNLLYFFKHMYDLIHAYYNHEQLHAYKRRLM